MIDEEDVVDSGEIAQKFLTNKTMDQKMDKDEQIGTEDCCNPNQHLIQRNSLNSLSAKSSLTDSHYHSITDNNITSQTFSSHSPPPNGAKTSFDESSSDDTRPNRRNTDTLGEDHSLSAESLTSRMEPSSELLPSGNIRDSRNTINT